MFSFRFKTFLGLLLLFLSSVLNGQPSINQKENAVANFKLKVYPKLWCDEHTNKFYYYNETNQIVDSCNTLDTICAYIRAQLEAYFGYSILPFRVDGEIGKVWGLFRGNLDIERKAAVDQGKYNRLIEININIVEAADGGNVGRLAIGSTQLRILFKIQEFNGSGAKLSKHSCETVIKEFTPVHVSIVNFPRTQCAKLNGNQMFDLLALSLENALK